METVTLYHRIEDYISDRLSEDEKADFEAEMMMDKSLENEVVLRILKKKQIEKRIQDHIEKAESERILSLQIFKNQKISLKDTIKQRWGSLLGMLSCN